MNFTDDTVKNAIEQNQLVAQQNNGLIESQNEYLQRLNPRAWYGQKFRTTIPGQFDSDMWVESARHGETDFLISALQKFEEELPKMDTSETDGINQWKFYASAGFKDYDTYMLALSLPMYDNTEKKLRTNGLDSSDPNYYEFGEYTDREWAQKMLMNQFDKYEGVMHDQMMMARSTAEKVFDVIGGGLASLGGHLVSGITRFVGDIFGLLDGISRAMTGGNFFDAFDPDNPNIFLYGSQLLDKALYETEMDTLGTKHISAQKAVEQGYSFLDKSNEVYGVGYEGIGQEWVGLVDSIGYMLPSILLGMATGGASTAGTAAASGITATMKTTSTIGSMLAKGAGFITKHLGTITFYSGIFSANVKENVGMYGLSEAKLNSGDVLSNAVLKTAAEAIVEYGLGKILGFTGLDAMIGVGQGTGLIQKAAGKTGIDIAKKAAKQATAKGLKAFGYAALNLGKDAFKEGLEEVLQDTATGLIDKAFGGDFYARGAENLSLQNLADSFIIGALSSVIVSTTQNLVVYGPDKGRLFITSEDGSVKRAGIMQSYNYAQSIDIMNEWMQTIKDVKVPTEERSTAMMKVSTMMGLMTKVFNAMGTDRVVQAHRLLYSEYEDEKTNAERRAELEQKFQGSNGSQTYAEALVESFFSEQTVSYLTYSIQKDIKKGEKREERRKAKLEKLKGKVKEAATKGAERLHEADVKKVEGIVDEEEVITSDTSMSSTMKKSGAADRLIEFCKKEGVTIVVVDSNATVKINDTIFASKKLVTTGDIESILAGSTREIIVNAVRHAIPDNLYQQLARVYKKITKSENFDRTDVIVALLFDKNFYTQALLRAENLKNVKEAIGFLAKFDNIVNHALSEEYEKNGITIQALKALMTRIHETMRAGLVIYGTQYVRVDWDTISKDILSDEDRKFIKEMTSLDPNVQISEALDSIAESKSSKSSDKKKTDKKFLGKKQRFSRVIIEDIEKSGFMTEDERDFLLNLSESDNPNDRFNARVILQDMVSDADIAYAAHRKHSKLVYLPVLSEKALSDMSYKRALENIWTGLFGMKPESIVSTYQTVKLLERAIRDIVMKGVEAADLTFKSNFIDYLKTLDTDSTQIFAILRDSIYEITEHEYTLGQDFSLVRVLKASDFDFETVRYDGTKTNKNNIEKAFDIRGDIYEMANVVKRLIEKGPITVKEFLQMSGNKEIREFADKLPEEILEVKIEIAENIYGENTFGLWDPDVHTISIFTQSDYYFEVFCGEVIDFILHELTHACTDYLSDELINKNIKNIDPHNIVAFLGTASYGVIETFGVEVVDEIFDYIVKNFAPALNWYLFHKVSDHIDSEKLSKISIDKKADMIYLLNEDETLARSFGDISLDSIGFTVSTDYTKIISPDGKKTWTAKKTSTVDKKKTQALIIRRETEKISKRREIQEFMKDAADEMKYEDGTAKIWYRGYDTIQKERGYFYSSSPIVSMLFTAFRSAYSTKTDISSNICNIPSENLLSINNSRKIEHEPNFMNVEAVLEGIRKLSNLRYEIGDNIGGDILEELYVKIQNNYTSYTSEPQYVTESLQPLNINELVHFIDEINAEYHNKTGRPILIAGATVANLFETVVDANMNQRGKSIYNPSAFSDDLLIFDDSYLKRLDDSEDASRFLGLWKLSKDLYKYDNIEYVEKIADVISFDQKANAVIYNNPSSIQFMNSIKMMLINDSIAKGDMAQQMASNMIGCMLMRASGMIKDIDIRAFDIFDGVFDITSDRSILKLSVDYSDIKDIMNTFNEYLENTTDGQKLLNEYSNVISPYFNPSPEEQNALLAYTTGHEVDDVDLSRFYDFLAWYRENVEPGEYGFDYETDMEEEYKNPNRYVQSKHGFIGKAQPLILRSESKKISADPKNQEFMKGASSDMKYKDGSYRIWNRGFGGKYAWTESEDKTDNLSIPRYYSSSTLISLDYGFDGKMKTAICNCPDKSLFSIDWRGRETYININEILESLLKFSKRDYFKNDNALRKIVEDIIEDPLPILEKAREFESKDKNETARNNRKVMFDILNMYENDIDATNENDIAFVDDVVSLIYYINKQYYEKTGIKYIIKAFLVKEINEGEMLEEYEYESFGSDDLVIFDNSIMKQVSTTINISDFNNEYDRYENRLRKLYGSELPNGLPFYNFVAWYRENIEPTEYGFDYERDMPEEYKIPEEYRFRPKHGFVGGKEYLKKVLTSDDTDITDEKKKKKKHAKGNVYSVADERSRYLSNREAMNSNMRYFIKPGKPIQIHPRIIDFIAGTPDAEKDPEGFKKLDGWLQKHIKAGDLTYDSLMNYVETTALMTDFSWQSVCRFVFRNEAAASLTFKQARDLILHAEEYAKDSYFLIGKYEDLLKKKKQYPNIEAEDESVKKMSYDEIKKKHDEIADLIQTDLKSQEIAVKAFEKVDDSTVNMLYGVWPFLNAFDGTFKSLAKTYNWCRMISSTQRMLDESMKNYLEGSASDTDEGSPVKVSTKHQFWYDTPEADKFYKENVVNEDLDFSIEQKRQFLKDELTARFEATYKNEIEKLREELMAMEFDDEEEDLASIMSEAPDSSESSKKSQNERINEILERKIEAALRRQFDMVDSMSEDDLNRNMLTVMASENKRIELEVRKTQAQARKGDTRQKSRMDTLRSLANRVGGKLKGINQKTFWNKAPAEVRDNIDPKTGKFNYNTINKLRGILDKIYAATSLSERNKALKELYNELSENSKNDKEIAALITQIHQERNEKRLDAMIKALREKVLAVEADYLIEKFRETNETLKSIFKKARYAEKVEEKLKKESEKLKAEKETTINKEGKNLKEKTEVIYITEVKDQRFKVQSSIPHTNLAQTLLETEWNKKRKYQIKYIADEDEEYYVANGTKFYRQNAEAFTNADLREVAETARYFLEAEIEGTEDDVNKFVAIRFYTLSYIYHESRKGGTLYIDDALREQIRQKIEQLVHNSAVLLAHWKMVINKINPARKCFKQALILSGYEVPDELTDRLFEAAEHQDAREIDEAQRAIFEDLREHQKQEKADRRVANLTWKERMKAKIKDQSLLRRITTFRSMMMLSSPMTALRNVTSNIFVTIWNRVGEKLGNNIFKKTKGSNQLSLKAPVTQRITTYINEHFIDNGLFDQLVSNITKYNPNEAFKDPTTGKPTRENIVYKMLLQSMYGKYYQENAFNTKWLNSVHKLIMKLLSDNSFVRRASIRYFGKILAERNYDAVNENREVNDAVMQDFGTAVGLALADYAHSSSFFSKIDQLIAERGDIPYFLWKLVMPFANTTQLWFQKAIDLSPIGLARSIYKMCTLEKQIILADSKFNSGKSTMSPELTEYLARRGIGQGVIGTIMWTLGALLAGLGFIRLDDDDYGIPKLHIGDLTVDVSSIFGSSSLLAGGALMSQIAQKGFTWDSLWTALSSSAYVYLDQWPLLDMLQYDMSADNFGYGVKTYFEQMALSFIPNLFSWIAGVTYTGTLKKTTFIGKAAAKIPFLGPVFNEKKVDPYTGDDGSFLDALGRFIPYLSFEDFGKSDYEKQALKRGLKKTQLKGQWNISGQNFSVSKKELQYINECYGNWNMKMFNDFYNNRLSMTIEDAETGKRVTKKFSQMNDEEIKSAIRQIMSKNSITAKILAWTRAGHKYYASATDFQYLRSVGITKNVYRGTNGFVK